MYQPAHFVESRPEVLQRLIREHPFGLLVTDGTSGLAANGVPFLLDPDPAGGPGVLRAHVARANPVWKEARSDRDSLVVFQGPQAYISPAWYPSKAEHGKVVPTWNYIAVHAYGPLKIVDDAEWLRRLLTRLTDLHESFSAVPWKVTDAPDAFIDQMLKGIVGIELPLTRLEGKWKLSQNRPEADRAGTVAGLEGKGDADSRVVASAMSAACEKEPTP
jgi:transcriptional regulator